MGKNASMKTQLLAGAVALGIAGLVVSHLLAADSLPASKSEYITIRSDGRDSTHVIRAGGRVECVGNKLRKVTRPERTDERAFYRNVVMNGLSKKAYEFAGMTENEVIMRRLIR